MTEQNTPVGVPAALKGIVDITYLDKTNCKLTVKNGFMGLRAIVNKPTDILAEIDAKKPDSAKEGKDGKEKDESAEPTPLPDEIIPEGKMLRVADRIFLSRAFPFDMPYEYISVLDKDKKEIGFIRSIADFNEEEQKLLREELDTKYYTPVIKRIMSVKERYGFSFWKTECEFGEKSFTLQDTFRSIIKATTEEGKERIFIVDVDGNRYEIPDVEALDRQSYKKIELYL